MNVSSWLEDCLERAARARVAVFGDFCLDAYWLVDPDDSELSVETGLPVRRVREQRYSLGGAGNIVANLAALGVRRVRAVGLVGNDLFGRQTSRMLDALGVDCSGLLAAQPDWQTPVYAKPYTGGVEGNRLDFGAFDMPASETIERLATALDSAAAASDAVILNQQIPAGLSTPETIDRINAVVASRPACLFIADSRHRADLYKGCLLKLNAHEASRIAGRPTPLDERIPAARAREYAFKLFERSGKPVFVTRGENGLIVVDHSGARLIPGIPVGERFDPVGAGDTLIAAAAAVLGSGGDAPTAARFANLAASITVRKLQTTGTASPEELRAAGPLPD